MRQDGVPLRAGRHPDAPDIFRGQSLKRFDSLDSGFLCGQVSEPDRFPKLKTHSFFSLGGRRPRLPPQDLLRLQHPHNPRRARARYQRVVHALRRHRWHKEISARDYPQRIVIDKPLSGIQIVDKQQHPVISDIHISWGIAALWHPRQPSGCRQSWVFDFQA
jgi:hypothetical protein